MNLDFAYIFSKPYSLKFRMQDIQIHINVWALLDNRNKS